MDLPKHLRTIDIINLKRQLAYSRKNLESIKQYADKESIEVQQDLINSLERQLRQLLDEQKEGAE